MKKFLNSLTFGQGVFWTLFVMMAIYVAPKAITAAVEPYQPARVADVGTAMAAIEMDDLPRIKCGDVKMKGCE